MGDKYIFSFFLNLFTLKLNWFSYSFQSEEKYRAIRMRFRKFSSFSFFFFTWIDYKTKIILLTTLQCFISLNLVCCSITLLRILISINKAICLGGQNSLPFFFFLSFLSAVSLLSSPKIFFVQMLFRTLALILSFTYSAT